MNNTSFKTEKYKSFYIQSSFTGNKEYFYFFIDDKKVESFSYEKIKTKINEYIKSVKHHIEFEFKDEIFKVKLTVNKFTDRGTPNSESQMFYDSSLNLLIDKFKEHESLLFPVWHLEIKEILEFMKNKNIESIKTKKELIN